MRRQTPNDTSKVIFSIMYRMMIRNIWSKEIFMKHMSFMQVGGHNNFYFAPFIHRKSYGLLADLFRTNKKGNKKRMSKKKCMQERNNGYMT